MLQLYGMLQGADNTLAAQCFVLSLERLSKGADSDWTEVRKDRIFMGKVHVFFLGEAIVQTENDLFMVLFHLGVSGVVQVFDLAEFDDCDLVCITFEQLPSCEDIEPDIVG